ncbi:hypothetical protein KL918_003227 [Ogataea parapolymorpha]|nr:hypothetical protein KL918_003227 [Ogataea parapolymorpha]KAG7872396.1 hypothetical protein KL916_003131 [Ogataea parapolymorpha]
MSVRDTAVHGQFKRVHPHEGDCRGGVDRVVRKVAASGGDYASNQQTDNHGAGLHDGGPPLLAQDDRQIHQEPEPEELRRPPVVALGTAVGGVHAARATHKVLKSGLDQRHTNEQHHRPRHDGGENALQQRWRQEREQHFKQTAHGRRAENGTVSVRTWQLRAVAVHGTNARAIHDWKSFADNANGGERRAHNGHQPGANVVGSVRDLETGDLDRRQQTRNDERARHQILLVISTQVGESANDDWR